ncbi:MAG: hypothetical protein SCALA702_11080 [Melioribacteraceae bacterium]|nr:MAG: hypothetical protein SCALA702_11080 [Melioribacteraceae bacterium]
MQNISKLFLILLFAAAALFAQDKKELEKRPFPIGGIEAIGKHVKYPEEAKKANIEGKVFVEAVISKDGKVLSTKVVKGLSKECDAAAEKAIKAVDFTPGEKDGKKVKATVTIPIMFKLK